MIALTLYHVELSTFRAIVCKWETGDIDNYIWCTHLPPCWVALLAVQCLALHTQQMSSHIHMDM